MEKLLNRPSVMEQFKKLRSDQNQSAKESSPLVVAAQSFASHLNGPSVNNEKEVVVAPRKIQLSTTVRHPRARIVPSAKFTLEGTSYYENQPERSIALISQPGSPERNKYWAKEGERLGHFVIHRIRHGVIVYRDGISSFTRCLTGEGIERGCFDRSLDCARDDTRLRSG